MESSLPTNYLGDIRNAAEGLRKLLPNGFVPEIGIVGGSGLSTLEQALHPTMRVEVEYGQIKGFPISTGQSQL